MISGTDNKRRLRAILEVWQQILVLQLVNQHQKICCRGKVAPFLTHEPIDLKEEDPEVSDCKEFVSVEESIQVKQLGEEELTTGLHVLELHFEDHAVVLL